MFHVKHSSLAPIVDLTVKSTTVYIGTLSEQNIQNL